MISEAERFDVTHPALCPHLRWKSYFIDVAPDPTVPPANSGHFWCVYTHNCLDPIARWRNPQLNQLIALVMERAGPD